MKILILCGVFHSVDENEVVSHARRPVEFSANQFQKKLIQGFCQVHPDTQVLSAPFLGSYPNASDIRKFKGFSRKQNEYTYVPFHNLWGYRNISRTRALKKGLADFIADPDKQKLILVYCAHTPFLEAAAYAKKKDPRIRICFYVPDLPEYMNLRSDKTMLYDIAKKADIAKMRRFMEEVDSFVLLTEPMKQVLPVGNKPCIVREGILPQESPEPASASLKGSEKYIVYTGKLDEKFGIPSLLEGFSLLDDPDLRLVLCGSGDCDDAVACASQKDSRIMALGQVTPAQAIAWQQRAAVLVNPRPDNEEYTRYSFPSKNIEYLLTGKPVVAYLLSGMPEVYQDFMCTIDHEKSAASAIAQAIGCALEQSTQQAEQKYHNFLTYAQQLRGERIANSILKIIF